MNINMFGTTEDSAYCCIFCKCVEEDKRIFKNKVLMNRIHTCRIVDILTEARYIDMYERMNNKQLEAYTLHLEKVKVLLSLGIEENK